MRDDVEAVSNVPETRTFTCHLCEAMCGLRVTIDSGRVIQIRGDRDDVFSRGHICPKGPALRELHEDPDRLRHPMRRTASGFERVTWDQAYREIAAGLRVIQRTLGRDAVALYIGNPTVHSHRAALGSQLLSYALRTHNRFDPNSQDSNPRLFACAQVYGEAMSMPVPDVDRTHHLLMLGANPAASNGSMMTLGDVRGRFRAIRARGGRVVLVDPRRTESTALCDEHHFIRPGGDAAFLLAVLHVLFAEGRVHAERVDEIARGRPELSAIAARFTPERVAASIGIAPEEIRRLAREFADAPTACAYARVGVCQSEFGPVACWLTEALNVVTGNFDRPGGSMFPTPPADVAALARRLIGSGYGRWRSRVRGLPEFLGSLPSAALIEEIETPGPGQIRALVCLAGNPVLSTPGGDRLAHALSQLELVVAIDFYLNETSRHAHFVLPPTHIFESGNYDLVFPAFAVRNVAKWSPPILPAPEGAPDDFEILAELAMRVALPDAELLRKALRPTMRTLPERVVDWLLRFGPYELSLAALAEHPHGVDLGALVPRRRDKVRTRDRRVNLVPPLLLSDLARLERWLDAGPPVGLRLIGRRDLRSNNSWMHNLHSLAKGPDRSKLLMHPRDAERLALGEGDRVRVIGRAGAVRATLALSEDMMSGVVSLPHGFGHTDARDTLHTAGALRGDNVNAVTDERFIEPLVGTSILNGVPVRVERDDA